MHWHNIKLQAISSFASSEMRYTVSMNENHSTRHRQRWACPIYLCSFGWVTNFLLPYRLCATAPRCAAGEIWLFFAVPSSNTLFPYCQVKTFQSNHLIHAYSFAQHTTIYTQFPTGSGRASRASRLFFLFVFFLRTGSEKPTIAAAHAVLVV